MTKCVLWEQMKPSEWALLRFDDKNLKEVVVDGDRQCVFILEAKETSADLYAQQVWENDAGLEELETVF